MHGFRVAVDPATGEVRVLRSVQAVDAGVVINPEQLRGQVEGGVAQGDRSARSTRRWCSRDGEVRHPHASATTGCRRWPTSPPTEVLFADTYDELGPRGAKSMSEAPYNPVAPALANAVRDALGVRPHELPMSRDRLWRLLRDATGPTQEDQRTDDQPGWRRGRRARRRQRRRRRRPVRRRDRARRRALSTGQNRVTRDNDPTAHAEVLAIRAACAGHRRLLAGRLRALHLLRALPAVRLGRPVGAPRPGRLRRRPRRRRPRWLRRPRVLRALRPERSTWPTLIEELRPAPRPLRRLARQHRAHRSTDRYDRHRSAAAVTPAKPRMRPGAKCGAPTFTGTRDRPICPPSTTHSPEGAPFMRLPHPPRPPPARRA